MQATIVVDGRAFSVTYEGKGRDLELQEITSSEDIYELLRSDVQQQIWDLTEQDSREGGQEYENDR